MRRLLLAAMLLGATACGNSSGPGQPYVVVNGQWTVSFDSLTVSGLGHCVLTDMTLTVIQDGTTLNGSHGPTDVTCDLIPTYTFTSGTISGSANSSQAFITLQSGADQKTLTAGVSGSTMSGGVRWVNGGVVAVGAFSAIKQ